VSAPRAAVDDLGALEDLRAAVAAADVVIPVGARTQWGVGGSPASGLEVMAPSGAIRHEPGDLTVSVGAGTPVAELDGVVGGAGQECPLDPRDPAATVGGVLACGLSGLRRLRFGPVRDRVLQVHFVTADGRVVQGGGPTVKNVSGFDIPRLLVGSLGTLGVLARVVLRCTPRPRAAVWGGAEGGPEAVRARLFRPSCVAWDGEVVRCLVEGDPDDVEAELAAGGLVPGDAPVLPEGSHRGRIAVPPGRVEGLGAALSGVDGVRWLAEVGVGTVHVAADGPGPMAEARRLAHERAGWLLREAGDGFDGFGRDVANTALMARVKRALDPTGKLNPGRLPW